MSDEGGVEMTGRPCLSMPVAPLANEDLIGEILPRVSPLPSSLPRASAVSKLWGHIATDPGFLRRFLAHHRKPLILGVFEKCGRELVFSSTLDPPDCIPPERFSLRPHVVKDDAFNFWTLLGCRHGRVLIINTYCLSLLLVFDPISRACHFVPTPCDLRHHGCMVRGAVLCAAGDDRDHVHGDCHSSPFKVVLVGTKRNQVRAMAWVYSSETGTWGDLVLIREPCGTVSRLPGTLIGGALYWWLNESQDGILEYDLNIQRLAVVKRPTFAGIASRCIRIIRAEGGGLGIVVLSYPRFQMWVRKVSSDGAATWILQRTVNMHKIIGLPSGVETKNEAIVGYSEDADAVFISVTSNAEHYAFVVQLDSMQSRELNGSLLEHSYHPFANFYTAGTGKASKFCSIH